MWYVVGSLRIGKARNSILIVLKAVGSYGERTSGTFSITVFLLLPIISFRLPKHPFLHGP